MIKTTNLSPIRSAVFPYLPLNKSLIATPTGNFNPRLNDSYIELEHLEKNLRKVLHGNKKLSQLIEQKDQEIAHLQKNYYNSDNNLSRIGANSKNNERNKENISSEQNENLKYKIEILIEDNDRLNKLLEKKIDNSDFSELLNEKERVINDLRNKYDEKCEIISDLEKKIETVLIENDILSNRDNKKKEHDDSEDNLKFIIDENNKLKEILFLYKEKFSKIMNFVKLIEEKDVKEEDYKLKIIDLEQKIEILLLENNKLHDAYIKKSIKFD